MKNNLLLKYFVNIVFIISFCLISFFGLGPVLMADGVLSERIFTLIIVVIIYAIWGILLRYWLKRYKR